MTVSELEFWFEFGSTYSYLSACRIEAVAAEAGVAVSWRPFLLGPIFGDQGWDDSPFNLYPAKGRYMWRDVERLCEGYGLSFKRPSRFPRSGLLASRVACLAEVELRLPEFVRAVFRTNFAQDMEISDKDVILHVLDSLGWQGEDLIERAKAPENKRLLRDRTEQARAKGIFGAPSFLARGELFWGDDRLEPAIAWLTANPGLRETR